jgi:hypothetical protein
MGIDAAAALSFYIELEGAATKTAHWALQGYVPTPCRLVRQVKSFGKLKARRKNDETPARLVRQVNQFQKPWG